MEAYLRPTCEQLPGRACQAAARGHATDLISNALADSGGDEQG